MRAAVEQFVGLFTNMGGLMAERATDLRDIERRVIANIVGEPEPGVPTPREPSVLVAEDLAPSDTAVLDPGLVLGLVTERGGPTSHTAIIARQLGLPCVVGAAGAMEIPAGTRVLLDGTTGLVEVDPDEAEAARRVARDLEDRAALDSWTGPGATADGTPVKLLANVADASSATTAASGPVGGVGLLRTELSFLNRQDEPSVEEQADIYAGILDAVRRGPVRRGPHPRRRVGQADRLRDHRGRGEPRARRPRTAALLRQPRPARAPARRDRAGRRAHRRRDLGDGTDGRHRRRGRGLRRQGP